MPTGSPLRDCPQTPQQLAQNLSRMDRILVFDQGKIVEEGSHAVPMSKKALYSKMWNMQVGGFLSEVPFIRENLKNQ